MTALTTLRDILGRATAGKLSPGGTVQEAYVRAVRSEHGARITQFIAVCKSAQTDNLINATAIVQSISLARVVVDPGTVEKAAIAMRRNRFERNGRGSIFDPTMTTDNDREEAQAVLECLASLVGEEGKP